MNERLKEKVASYKGIKGNSWVNTLPLINSNPRFLPQGLLFLF
jgi:hypothetical protein